MKPISQWQFDIYALSRDRGHDFEGAIPQGAIIADNGLTLGATTRDLVTHSHGFMIWRRRVDGVWQHAQTSVNFSDQDAALSALKSSIDDNAPALPVPPGVPVRQALYDFGGIEPTKIFKYLMNTAHAPAAWVLNQVYMALPRPDPNWASDARGQNFHTRLWEAHLLASFREQGLLVEQPYDAPDFRVENGAGEVAWVEAVTANPPNHYEHVNAPLAEIPESKEELFFGAAAVRFAKTLGSKLQRNYADMPHVSGNPLVLAIADFQAGGSMVWSREALLAYLMGVGAKTVEVDGQIVAAPWERSHLLGPSEFPSGLFTDDRNSELSAVIFTNACAISKFNRVGVTGNGAPEGYRYTRFGMTFDTRPGAIEGIPFCHDIRSPEYLSLWPQGYEPWSAEMEVIHNPYAKHPITLDMFPETTQWFLTGDEWVCTLNYPTSILWSRSIITGSDQKAPTLTDLFGAANGAVDGSALRSAGLNIPL